MSLQLPREVTLSPAQSGQRLDAALSALFPSLGVRGRRRLWDWCLITVNGKPRPAGYVVRQGEVVRVSQGGSTASITAQAGEVPPLLPGLAAVSPDYLAFAKPSGLHTVHIEGGAGENLETLALAHWQEILHNTPKLREFLPDILCAHTCIFLTRLDRGTSGLVLAARSKNAAARFRQMEEAGDVKKSYYAVIDGALIEELRIGKALLTADRQVTKVLEAQAEPTRITTIRPLGPVRLASRPEASTKQTLVQAQIQRGARHQIRAHLASAGFPLWGDPLYGNELAGKEGFFLHHAAVAFPEFQAVMPLPPSWQCWTGLEPASGLHT